MKEKLILAVFLGICSMQDLREKRISISCLRWGMAAALLSVIWNLAAQRLDVRELVFSILPGILLFVYSRITKEKLGEADGWMVMVQGMLLGWRDCVEVLILADLLLCAASFFLLALHRADRNTKLPFAPYLLAAFVLGNCVNII